MGFLSDLFSGKRKREQALARLKANAAAFAFAGISIASPMKAFASTGTRAPAEKAKTEQVDSLAKQIKFKDSAVQSAAERMMKTPTGRKVLEGLHALNVDVSFDSSVSEDLGGYYSAPARKILLNSNCNDDLIASILVHEGSHALQASRCRLGPGLDMQTYFSVNKAMEADAMKNQVFAAYELKEQGDASVFNAFKTDRPMLAKAYLDLRETYKDNPDSLAKHTMLAYYKDYDYVKTYEDRYVKAISTFNGMAKPENIAGAFQLHLSEADIIDRICQLDGKHYMQPADSVYLQSPECNYIQKSTYKSLVKIADKFAKKVSGNAFFKADNSYADMYVVDYKGRLVKEMPQPKSALKSAQKNMPVNGEAGGKMPVRPLPQRRTTRPVRPTRREGR